MIKLMEFKFIHIYKYVYFTSLGLFNENVRTEFCMKTTALVTVYDRTWPAGDYCILKKARCPYGKFNTSKC